MSSLRCLKYEESKDSKETWHQSSNVQELKKEVIHLYEVVEEETDDEKENSDLKMEVERLDECVYKDTFKYLVTLTHAHTAQINLCLMMELSLVTQL